MNAVVKTVPARAMPATPWLRMRMFLLRRGAVLCVAVLFCVLGLAAWAWLLTRPAPAVVAAHPPASAKLGAGTAPPVLASAAPPASAAQNMALFYANLGEQRYAEQQVGTLFALAAKNGLSLNRGEYKAAYDQAGRFHTYQVVLPVKGSYQSIWQFSLQALRAVPFASLDEIGFKREAIGESMLDARLRLTFYLRAPGAGAAP